MLKNGIILLSVLFVGFIYYIASVKKSKFLQQYAFYIKIALLVLSFILAFVEQDFIVIGCLAFGGRTPVLILALIEIVDTLIDRKEKMKPKK